MNIEDKIYRFECNHEFEKKTHLERVYFYCDYYIHILFDNESTFSDIQSNFRKKMLAAVYSKRGDGNEARFEETFKRYVNNMAANSILLSSHEPRILGGIIIYIASILMHTPLSARQMSRLMMKKNLVFTEVLKDVTGILLSGWYEQTEDYKKWAKYIEWKKNNPSYTVKVDEESYEERIEMLKKVSQSPVYRKVCLIRKYGDRN